MGVDHNHLPHGQSTDGVRQEPDVRKHCERSRSTNLCPLQVPRQWLATADAAGWAGLWLHLPRQHLGHHSLLVRLQLGFLLEHVQRMAGHRALELRSSPLSPMSVDCETRWILPLWDVRDTRVCTSLEHHSSSSQRPCLKRNLLNSCKNLFLLLKDNFIAILWNARTSFLRKERFFFISVQNFFMSMKLIFCCYGETQVYLKFVCIFVSSSLQERGLSLDLD